ncbi:hypothetical protein [Bacillus sp. UNC438CL73TsuS30]|uniref:hypothetical protein n=1 Tax=Bacillus sp. UNC438CL73TsuS30 TaxID=1340434 RepID=UPI00047ECBC3|nr:hypothetical protein [Bacillus sp. UNC438CL73TsuS30]
MARTIIRILKKSQEWKEAFPILKQLRTHLNEASFLQFVQEAVEKEGYQLAAFEDEILKRL